jgi:hypothetical protein
MSIKLILFVSIIKLIVSNPSYDINLDLTLREQYAYVINHKEEISAFIKASNMYYATKPELVDHLNHYYDSIINNQNATDWLERIRIIAELTGNDFKQTLMLNIGYEVFCTTLLVKTEKGIFMGRNFDTMNGTTPELLRIIQNNSYSANHYRNGELLYISQGVLGYVGWLNGIKVGKFVISLNKRRTHSNIMQNIVHLAEGKVPSVFVLNEALHSDESYEEAIWRLSETHVSSVIYYICASYAEGTIISKNVDNVDRVDYLNDWFLVQTNADREIWDPRRDGAEKKLIAMKERGEEISYDNIMNEILSKPPNWLTSTVYSTIQSVDGYFESRYYKTE